VPDTSVFVIQNNHPQPLVRQGDTRYVSDYRSGLLPWFDPDPFFAQEQALQKAGSDTQLLRHARYNDMLQSYLAHEAPAKQRIAAGQAAEMVLSAAGLSPEGSAGGQDAFVISRDSQGVLSVQSLTTEQVRGLRVPDIRGLEDIAQPDSSTPAAGGLIGRYCGQCHGLDVASPKKGLFLGDDTNVSATMREKWFSITSAIKSGAMPPSDSVNQPTDNERVQIVDELRAIIFKYESE
jgi:mono/diheme cytochrome c family protein